MDLGPRCTPARLESFVAQPDLYHLWSIAVAVVNNVARIKASEPCPIAWRPAGFAIRVGHDVGADDIRALTVDCGLRAPAAAVVCRSPPPRQ
jgi:hypothetical protein